MFILDSLFLSGFRWVLDTVRTAAEAERDDDTSLRELLLEAEMRREMGEISDDEFADIEADVLARIREIKVRREGGSGAIAVGGQPIETTPDSQFQVEATVSGDFHQQEDRSGSSGTVIEGTVLESVPVEKRRTKRTKRTTGTKGTRTVRTSRNSRAPRKLPKS
jgi:hypothetical protein